MSEPAKVTGEAECPFCGGWGYPPHDPYGMCDMCGGDGALPIIELKPNTSETPER